MTDFELYSSLMLAADSAEAYTDRFVTLLFAFLIAGYLVAARLDRIIVLIVISLYSVMAFRYGLIYFNVSGDVIALADVLRQRSVEPESGLFWLDIGPISVNYMGVLILYLLSYSASIVFFFHMRGKSAREAALNI